MDKLFPKLIVTLVAIFIALFASTNIFGYKTNAQRAKEKLDTMQNEISYPDIETGMRKIAQDSDNTNSAITSNVYARPVNDSMYYCLISVPYLKGGKTQTRTYMRLYNSRQDKFFPTTELAKFCCLKKVASMHAVLTDDLKLSVASAK